LSFAETYFVSSLGMHAVAAASLVVPVMMLMTMIANGGIGGGVSAAIARARGAGASEEADSLVWHALVIGVVSGALFMVAMAWGGARLFHALGGDQETLRQARLYASILFGGAIVYWALTMLQSALRGAGAVRMAAIVMLGGVVVGLALSPALIMGWFGLPRLGIAGAGLAQVFSNTCGLLVLVAYMRSPMSPLRLRCHRLRRAHFAAILQVGLPSTVGASMSNLSITALTAAAGMQGAVGLAAYGIASRLELMLMPIMFGFGTAVVAVVGTSLGAGLLKRARYAAIVNALVVACVLELIGIAVACRPHAWLGIFTRDPAVLAIGADYLHWLGPTFGFIALLTELYFAGQGANRLLWPLIGGAVRLAGTCCLTGLVLWCAMPLHAAFGWLASSVIAAGCIALAGFIVARW
jgi:putative MATE family efflux protein